MTSNKDIVLVTTTFYTSTDQVRFVLACETVKKAVLAGYTIVIVDGSPIREVASTLTELGAHVFPELHRGMGPSRRQAFFHAIEIAHQALLDKVLWLEAEKEDLVRSVGLISEALNTTDLIVVGRKDSVWQTYPPFQVESEKQANKAWEEATGLVGFDPFFGPVGFRVSACGQFFVLNSPKKLGVEDTYVPHYATLLSLEDEHNVVKSLLVDFVYPPAQLAEELGAQNPDMLKKRTWQRETLIAAYQRIALLLFLK